ncbi:MAG TPA: GDSL-type esterase/lipase family protein [Ktedonobacteraceae bacterium]
MMQRWIWSVVRVGLLCLLALALAVGFAPLTFRAARFLQHRPAQIGPKAYYMALGDSLAYGFQPNLDWADGYANVFFSDLEQHGTQHSINLACTDESTTTLIKGGCPFALLRKSLYTSSQLQAAVSYLHAHAGQVSPVTLDIGANDLIPDLNTTNCSVNAKWESDLATVDNSLKNIILPQLVAAMTVNGQMTGDLLLLNYYDPYQVTCPNTVPYIHTLNQHLAAAAVASSATLVDISSAFTGSVVSTSTTPVSTICTYTWMCSSFKNIHPNKLGYGLMAGVIEHTVSY